MTTTSRSAVWVDHQQDGVRYQLKHLHPKYVIFTAEAQDGRPERNIRVRIEYSHHCFSQDPGKLDSYDPNHLYLWEARPDDPRVFCPIRWESSKILPGLVENLSDRNCYPTRRDNYFAVKRDLPSGHYVLYFRAERKRTGGADVRLFVESAYHRDDMDEVLTKAPKTSIVDILLKA